MSDYINRYAVLNVIDDAIANNALSYESCVNEIMESIAKLPVADVRSVVRGKWIVSAHKTYYDVRCSACGINSFFQVDEKDSISYANFCPNCGADMRGEADEES